MFNKSPLILPAACDFSFEQQQFAFRYVDLIDTSQSIEDRVSSEWTEITDFDVTRLWLITRIMQS